MVISRLITDASGTTQASYTFDAFGNLTGSTGTVTSPFRFGGQYWDSESGLYYLRARYYDTLTSQFLSQDPMLPDTLSPYGYVKDDPLNATDPTGLLCNPFSGGCEIDLPGGLCIANGNQHCNGGDTGLSNLQDNLADDCSPWAIRAIRTFSAPISLGVDIGHRVRGDEVSPTDFILDAMGFVPFGGALGVGKATWGAIQVGRVAAPEATRAAEEALLLLLKELGSHFRQSPTSPQP